MGWHLDEGPRGSGAQVTTVLHQPLIEPCLLYTSFCARHVPALSPSMRFALHKDSGGLATEIKAVHFL